MRDYICWFDWAGISVANNTSKTFTTPDGLTVKVTFTNVTGPTISPYAMNTWSGAVLWQLYDFSDPLVMPALFSQGTINPASFAMNIYVTRSGVPTPFTFVAADAEASAASEVTKINTSGTPWRTIEFFRNSTQTSNPLTGCGTQTVNLSLTYGDAPETGQNPILATDANGSLVITTTMNRTEQGGMALAFGIFAPVDRGDLPFPYPQAQHGLRFTTKNSCNFNAPFPTIMQDASLRLGSVAGDADGSQTLDDNAAGVDEDAVSSFPPYNGSGSYTIPVSLRNITGAAAYLTGWFDYNRDKNFTSNETVAVTVPNGATSASLTWTGLPASLAQGTLSDFGFRFRLSSNATEAQSAGGYARDGEIEDYLIAKSIIVPQNANVQVSFNAPDTVCVNNPVVIANTSVGASSYYWNFCVADIANTPPQGVSLGNPNGLLTIPVFMDYVQVNNNYYGFVVNLNSNRLIRLDYGNSLLNMPTAINLGNFGGVIPPNAEGIQMVFNDGKWYAIIVGGSLSASTGPRIVKLDFGSDITNITPAATNWGNIGGLTYPVDLHIFKENNNWFGFTVNAESNTITRFNFGATFDLTPTGLNLGNIGNLDYPTGIFAINNKGNWHVFITNAGSSGSNSPNSSLTRLDFGNSLLNTPVGVNLGNLNNTLHSPRDLYILNFCDQLIGFVTNYSSVNDIVRLNFNNSLNNVPTASSLGNIGNLNFPHSISKLFRVGPDLYGFITNAVNNTIARIMFSGCTNSSIPNATLQNPPAITYSTPGTYSINLTVDDGLPTQSSYCKQVVVLAPPTHSPTKTLTICKGGSVKIGSNVKSAGYSWSTGETTDSITITSTGTYWVESDRFGCSVRDSFVVTQSTGPTVQIFNSDTSIYAGDFIQLNSFSSTGTYEWSPANSLNCVNCTYPIASPSASTTYVLSSKDACEEVKDSVRINVITRTASLCHGFQKIIGTTAYNRAVDVASSLNDEFFTVGITKESGNDDILISKLSLDGNIIWSKVFGAAGAESVRKVAATADGGLLVTGQTKSFGNANGDILAFKINNSGSIVWSRKFGIGSTYGDLGMDIIETTDGGYAISGIINVIGKIADAVVIKLDNVANVVWTKRFDHLDGDDGVGIVQKGDTLVVAIDLQNSFGDYTTAVTKLKLADGSFITAKKLTPAARGLFNPYLYKNPAKPGYIISGHTIDGTSYTNMKHVIITLNDNLDVVNTKLISVNPATDDYLTGFVPLSDGGAIGCASPQSNADGYLYRINSDNTVAYAKKFNGTADRRLYRLTSMGQDVIAVGGTVTNGQEDFFITDLGKDGTLGPNCEVEDITLSIQQPAYTSNSFTWSSISNVTFANTSISLAASSVVLSEADLCLKSAIDFGYQQEFCNPKEVQFTSKLPAANSFQWNFGNGQVNSNSQTPSITYADYGVYNVKLFAKYGSGCVDSLMKPVTIEALFDKALISNSDTTICLGDSVLLKTKDSVLNYCWKTTDGNNPSTLNAYVKPTSPVTYVLSGAVVGKNLVSNGNFSLGNSGFISDYVFTTANNTEGQYWVGANPNAWNTSLSRCPDHTTGSGNMMTVNGSPSANAKVWSQKVAVTPNTNYTFATWIQSLISTNPAHLQFSINNVNLGNSVDANANPCQWSLFTSTWNSGSATTAVITIVNDNTTIAGNDFALDDIFFGTATTKTDSLTVNVTGLCDSIKIAGLDKVCSKTDTITYSIYRSASCTQPYSVVVDNSFVDVVSQSANSLKLVFKQNGNTLVKVGFNNGCKIVMDSVLVAVKFSPGKIDLGPDVTTCKDTLFTLDAPGGFESYQWQDGSTDSTFTVNGAGNYFVLAENFCNNQFKDSFKLIKTFPSPFAISPLNAAVCKGDSVQFSASGGTIYSWQPATEFNDAGSTAPKAVINASQDFSVQISDPFCGTDTLIVIPVIAKERADISILKKNDVNCQLDSTQLLAGGGVQYTWSPNLYITRSSSNQITVKPPKTITYYVEGKDAGGCIGQDSVTVYFNKEGEQKLYLPNAFTPNNDGLNDIFRPIFTGPATKFDFRIFNRWGQLIFQTNTPNEGWNGMFKGTAQPKDVYVYYITAEGGCNGTFERKGTFVLIK